MGSQDDTLVDTVTDYSELISDLFDNIGEGDGELPWWVGAIKQLIAQIEQLEKDSGEVIEVKDDIVRVVYDQRDIIQRPKKKWYNPNTHIGDTRGSSRLTKKRGICVHHTAVQGGFGPHKDVVKHFTSIPFDKLDLSRFSNFFGDDDLEKMDQAALARAFALAARYRGDPPKKYNMGVSYHALSAANSVLYLNLPFDWVSWHGNGANTHFLGYGWDGLSSKESPPAFDLIEDLSYLIETARSEGHPIEELTAHCCWTNKARDPGAEFIREVMMPVRDKYKLTMDMDFKASVRGAMSLNDVLRRAA